MWSRLWSKDCGRWVTAVWFFFSFWFLLSPFLIMWASVIYGFGVWNICSQVHKNKGRKSEADGKRRPRWEDSLLCSFQACKTENAAVNLLACLCVWTSHRVYTFYSKTIRAYISDDLITWNREFGRAAAPHLFRVLGVFLFLVFTDVSEQKDTTAKRRFYFTDHLSVHRLTDILTVPGEGDCSAAVPTQTETFTERNSTTGSWNR